MIMQSSKINRTVFVILLLSGFFGLKILHYNMFDYLYLLGIVAFSLPAIKSKSPYSAAIILYVLFLLLSCIYSWRYNGQRIYVVIGHSYAFFALLFFFILFRLKLSYREAEKVLVKVSLCFCFCYIIQWVIYPVVIFSSAESDININAYYTRFRMPCSICGYFLLMYAINRFLLSHHIKYIVFGVLAFIPIIAQGFRSMIALTLFSFFMIIPFVQRSIKQTILYGYRVRPDENRRNDGTTRKQSDIC